MLLQDVFANVASAEIDDTTFIQYQYAGSTVHGAYQMILSPPPASTTKLLSTYKQIK